MPDDSPSNGLLSTLPSSFFESLIKDISVETWGQLLRSNPTLKGIILEGFTVPAGKVGRILRQPQIVARLQRLIRSEEAIFKQALQLWGQEQLATVAFLEMLDRDFVLDNWQTLKNFIGPERFFAALKVLGHLDDTAFQELIGEHFWERQIDDEVVLPLTPFWELWQSFVMQFPQAKDWLPQAALGREAGAADRGQEGTQAQGRRLQAIEERCSKLQMKLHKAEEEKAELRQEIIRYRREQEELRSRMAAQEKGCGEELRRALADMRCEWFKRYQAVDEPALREADGRFESLLQRTERAFVLQQRADEEYGLVGAVRQKLLRVDLYLKEIERIHADSLVVHREVTRVKEALLQTRANLLRLPGIQKVLQPGPPALTAVDLQRQIRLLEAIPENLPKVTELLTLVARLADLEVIGDPQVILEAVDHKKRQIMENLYAQYQVLQEQLPRGHHFENLEGFVKSRESQNYDLYVDGYNILLTLHGRSRESTALPLAAVREQLTAAVVRKGQLFRRVYLVFDGQEDSRDRQGNTEIIFTDKNRGNTADAHIIQAVQKRKDRLVLLATADQGIIKAVADRIYALVDPYHLYLFAFDLPFPELV